MCRASVLSAVLVTLVATPVRAHAAAPELDRAHQSSLALFLDNVERGAKPVPGTVIVQTRAGTTLAALETAARANGCRVERQMGKRPIFVLDCDRRRPLITAIAALEKDEAVRYVEASYVEDELDAEPNDLLPDQWHHRNTGQAIDGVAGIAGADIGSIAAWDITTGSEEIVVAVHDTGIYPDHVDLAGRLWTNTNEICGNRVDDDQNGYVDDCNGWDVGEHDNDPDPRTLPADSCNEGHATFIAGLIGAAGNNGTGVTGINWNVKLMSVKRVHDNCGATSEASIEGTAYAIDNGAKVISIAFNGTAYSNVYASVLVDGASKGVVVVSSAGNDAENDDLIDRYPSNYDFDTKIVVANTTNRDVMSPASNFGQRNVHMAAPGADIYSTGMDSATDYDRASGTSFSQAIVAGAVALVYSAHPNLPGPELVAAMLEGSHKLAALDCARTTRCVSSGGRLDMPGALAKAAEKDGAFKLAISGYAVNDSSDGDGDGALEAREFAALDITIVNEGTSFMAGLEATVEMPEASPFLSFIDTTARIANLDPGASASSADSGDSFTLEIAEGCDSDFIVPLVAVVRDGSAHAFSLPFDLEVKCATGGTPKPVMDPDAGMSGGPMQNENDAGIVDREPLATDDSGCTSTHAAGGSAGVSLLLAIGALIVLRSRTR